MNEFEIYAARNYARNFAWLAFNQNQSGILRLYSQLRKDSDITPEVMKIFDAFLDGILEIHQQF